MKKEKYLRKIALIVIIMILIFTIKVQAIENSSITISFDRANAGAYTDLVIEMISGTTATFNIGDSYLVSTNDSSIGICESAKTLRANETGETIVTVKPVDADSSETSATYTLKVYDSMYQTIEEAKNNSENDEKVLNEIKSGLVSTNVTKDYFRVAKAKNLIPLQIKSNSEGKVVWTFNSIANTNIDLKTDVTVSQKTESPKVIFLKFAHSGSIQGKANVDINVGTGVFGTSNTTGLCLFTYNESTKLCKKILPISAYSNGKISFTLDEQTIASTTSYVVFADSNNIEIGKEISLPKSENNNTQNQIKNVTNTTAPKTVNTTNTTTNQTRNTVANNTTKPLDNEPKTGEDSWVGFSVMLAIVSLGIAIITKK